MASCERMQSRLPGLSNSANILHAGIERQDFSESIDTLLVAGRECKEYQ